MDAQLSPWWRRSLVVLMVCGFSVLGFLAARTYRDAPPIPARVVDEAGRTLFTGADITAGQQVFLRHGLMENGSIWGHGAYLGPDFSAEYLHTLGLEVQAFAGAKTLPRSGSTDVNFEPALDVEVARILKRNRYEASTGKLMFTDAEAASFRSQHDKWRSYFADPASNGGLPKNFITDPVELHQLTAFFAWSAWASVARRPGKTYSYTNNFPYDPLVGNTPTSAQVLWSAMSLLTLLGGLAAVLFAFGRFDFLGWQSNARRQPAKLPHSLTTSQLATSKYFLVVSLLFLAQVLVGGGVPTIARTPAASTG